MKRYNRMLGAIILGAAVWVFGSGAVVHAERVGGPASEVRTARGFQSVFFDTAFLAGRPAVVTILGNGATNLELIMYDADNHIAVGGGIGDQKSVSMDVYRTGLFRIEVRNLGALDNTFIIRTN